MTDIFLNVAVVIAVATVLAAIFSRLKQPLVVAFILAGVIGASSGVFGHLMEGQTLEFFSELGIAFALFLVGLELKFSDIKQVGKASLAVGVGQVVSTTAFGFLLAILFFGIPAKEAIYLGLALTFSSTLIVVQILTQKRDLDSLYGKIAIGYLLVQDFIAVGIMIFLVSAGKPGVGEFVSTIVLGGLLVGLILFLNKFVLQKLFDFLANDTQVLFLAGVAWALMFAAVSVKLGFSLEIGGFLAGLGLASIREEKQIASWVRPLRDLFIVIFFLSVGLKLSISVLLSILVPLSVISLFVLIGNPLIMMVILHFLGFRRRTLFYVGLTSAQVSEFSLIFIVLAHKLGLVSENIVHITTAVALVTIVISTYMMLQSAKLFKILFPVLKIFERKHPTEKPFVGDKEFSNHVILVGAGRLGTDILNGLVKKQIPVVVVDFDPKIVKKVERMGIDVLYGDIADLDIFDKALGNKPKILISTVFDKTDTAELLAEIKRVNHKVPVVVTSPDVSGALDFYKNGASYVIVPRILSSHLMREFIVSDKFENLGDGSLRKEQIEELGKHKEID